MIQLVSPSLRRASIVGYPERNSLLILRAANGRVLREIIYPSDPPECWDIAYRALRREAAILGYEVQDDAQQLRERGHLDILPAGRKRDESSSDAPGNPGACGR